MDIDFSLVSKHHITSQTPVDTFECVEPTMKKFITEEALDDQENMLGKTTCWVLDNKILLGFITLSSYSINKDEIPDDGNNQFRYRKIPAVLIGQLAAHKDYSGNSLGIDMLDYAIKKAYSTNMDIGCRLLALHTLNARAQRWYTENTPFKLTKKKNNTNSTMYIDLLKK